MKQLCVLHAIGMMHRGGSETMLMNVFRHIDRDKFTFKFLTHSRGVGAYDEEIRRLGGALYFIPSLGTLGYVRYIFTLYRFIRKEGPFDIVHSHLDWQGGAIAAAAKLAGVTSVIVHSHSSTWFKPDTLVYNVLHRFNRLLIAMFATEGWACSQEAANFLFGRRLFTRGRYRKIPNAIDLDRYRTLSKESASLKKVQYGISSDTLILGHVGSFSKPKNHDFLIELAVRLKSDGTDFRLLFVGDGGGRKKIEDRVIAHDLTKHVLFLGMHDDIPDCMNMFDALLFPSLFEGLGIVAIEAQAAGVPCLVSVHVPSEVDMGLGLVTRLPIDSVNGWISALNEIQTRRCNLRPRIEEQITSKGYNIQDSVKNIACYYESLCENTPPS